MTPAEFAEFVRRHLEVYEDRQSSLLFDSGVLRMADQELLPKFRKNVESFVGAVRDGLKRMVQ